MTDVGRAPSPALLTLEGIGLHYGGVRALDGLSFRIETDGLYGVMGANGAGKSSMFNVISGLTPPSVGQLHVRGTNTTGLREWQVARLGLSRTFQNIRLLTQLSVRDNLIYATAALGEGLFWPALWGRPAAKRFADRIAAHADQLLGALELWDERHRLAVALPYGLQRRLEIGRALMRRPKLLLLDEPAAGMNPTEKQALARMLPRLLSGTSSLIIEHDLSFLMRLCTEVLVLHQGALLTRGSAEAIRQDPRVMDQYFGAAREGLP